MFLVYKVSAFLTNMTVPTISKEYTIFAKIFLYYLVFSWQSSLIRLSQPDRDKVSINKKIVGAS